MYYIYLIINKINDKKYVGYTSKHYEDRYNEHIRAAKRGKNNILYQAIRKYGIENFELRPLSTAKDLATAKIWEQRTVLAANTYYKNKCGYNMTKGGDGSGPHTEEYKRYMSELMKNREYSEETRKKMSNSAKNKLKSEEFKKRVSAKLKADPNISERNRNSAIKGHLTKKRKKLLLLLEKRINSS